MGNELTGAIDWRLRYRSLEDMARARLEMMLRCCPRLDVIDPEAYSAGLLSALLRYSGGVIWAATEPSTGVLSRCKYRPEPTIFDVVEYCDEEAARRYREPCGVVAVALPAGEVVVERGAPRLGGPPVHVGEILRRHGFFDLARKFGSDPA